MRKENVQPSSSEYQLRAVHAIRRHLVPGAQALVFVDDVFGRDVRSALLMTHVLHCSEDDLYTAVLTTDPQEFPELHQGGTVQFRLEHVYQAANAYTLSA